MCLVCYDLLHSTCGGWLFVGACSHWEDNCPFDRGVCGVPMSDADPKQGCVATPFSVPLLLPVFKVAWYLLCSAVLVKEFFGLKGRGLQLQSPGRVLISVTKPRCASGV